MTVKGHVYLITNSTVAFAPIILNNDPPSSGFAPVASPFVVTLQLFMASLPSPCMGYYQTPLNTKDGSFEISVPPLISTAAASQATINLSFFGFPIYRSAYFSCKSLGKEINIYLFQPNLPTTDGIQAGQISSALSTSGLPGNASITANQYGLNISASTSKASLNFGIAVIPDTSPNLGVYFDLALNGFYNIHVDSPWGLCESASDVLNSIRSGLQTDGSAMNFMVENQIKTILLNNTSLDEKGVNSLVANVSIQFADILLINEHTWPLSNLTDKTVIILPQPVIGYPPQW
jgi:hypothetical protein